MSTKVVCDECGNSSVNEAGKSALLGSAIGWCELRRSTASGKGILYGHFCSLRCLAAWVEVTTQHGEV